MLKPVPKSSPCTMFTAKKKKKAQYVNKTNEIEYINIVVWSVYGIKKLMVKCCTSYGRALKNRVRERQTQPHQVLHVHPLHLHSAGHSWSRRIQCNEGAVHEDRRRIPHCLLCDRQGQL